MEPAPPERDDSAFVAQLTECQVPLGLYVRSLMPGDRTAGDVVQQANAKIWEKRDEFQPGTNFKAWAMSIARFEVLNFRKQQARDARLTFSDDLEVTLASEIATMDDDFAERHEALKQCLQGLKADSRELLMWRYGSRETLAEFAERVGTTVGSLKVKLHRLRNSLAGCIERRLLVGEVSNDA